MTIDLEHLETTWSFNEGETLKTSKRSILVSTAQAFIEKLKMVNLLNWKAKYIEAGVCDGTHWSVEIFTVERTIKSMTIICSRRNGSCFVSRLDE